MQRTGLVHERQQRKRWLLLGLAVLALPVGALVRGAGRARADDAVLRVFTKDGHSLAVTADGRVWAWGANGFGQLGLGDTANRLAPTEVAGLSGVAQAATGVGHSLARTAGGAVLAWGWNANGQLGLGDTANRFAPTPVPGLSGITAVAAGPVTSFAVASDGSVYAWGHNNAGQLGLGDTANRLSPVQVPNLSGVTAVAAGTNHTLFLKSDGTVWAAGQNSSGELGQGDTLQRSTPVAVPGLTNVVAVGAGNAFSVALRADGTVLAWGLNNNRQLGLGDTANRLSPVQVPNLSGVTAVAAGVNHTLALGPGGTVWAFGYNAQGQLGQGNTSTTAYPTPVQVPGLSGVVGVAAGNAASFAVTADGTTYAWGANGSGRLGLGDTTNRSSPTAQGSYLPPVITWGTWSPPQIVPGATTVFTFTLSRQATVAVGIVDGSGTEVRTLAGGTVLAGTVQVGWDGLDGNGAPVPPGPYYLRVFADGGDGADTLLTAPDAVTVLGSQGSGGGCSAGGTVACGTASIQAGPLGVDAPDAVTWAVTLTGFDQAVAAAVPITVVDATGSGGGWHVTLAATRFATQDGRTLPADVLAANGDTGSATAVAPPPAACAAGSTCTAPVAAAVAYPVAVPGGTPPVPVKVYSAATESGIGAVVVQPVLWLRIPASVETGTYASTLTFAVNAGP